MPRHTEELSVDLYDDEVFYTDHQIGLVREKLDTLGLLDDTVLILTSDHGEDLDLHGLWGHATVHETTIAVPLIIRDPRTHPGKRVSGFVQHADHLPTILEYFPQQQRLRFRPRLRWAITCPTCRPNLTARASQKLSRGERQAPQEIVVESGEHRAYLAPPWKLIWYKDGRQSELFHLSNDPLELNDRANKERQTVGELEEKLRRWVEGNLAGERADPIYAVDGAWTCYIGHKGEN